MTEMRRLVTGLTRLLGAKYQVVSRLRKRAALGGGEVGVYISDVQGKPIRYAKHEDKTEILYRSYHYAANISSSLRIYPVTLPACIYGPSQRHLRHHPQWNFRSHFGIVGSRYRHLAIAITYQ